MFPKGNRIFSTSIQCEGRSNISHKHFHNVPPAYLNFYLCSKLITFELNVILCHVLISFIKKINVPHANEITLVLYLKTVLRLELFKLSI
jgi:hypothetical protein